MVLAGIFVLVELSAAKDGVVPHIFAAGCDATKRRKVNGYSAMIIMSTK